MEIGSEYFGGVGGSKRGIRDGRIAGVAKVVDGSCTFCILILIGK